MPRTIPLVVLALVFVAAPVQAADPTMSSR